MATITQWGENMWYGGTCEMGTNVYACHYNVGEGASFLFDSNSTSIRAFSHYQDIYLDTLISANMKGYLFRHFNKC